MSTSHKYNLTEERALALLGSGVGPEQTAATIGVTTSAISQLLADENFALEVSKLRYEALSKHNARDSTYDQIEDALIQKLQDLLPLMMRPMEVLKAIATINAAKRRGSSAPAQVTNQQNIVNVIMPVAITNRFTLNAQNQVVQVGAQELLTIQSGTLLSRHGGTHDAATRRIASGGEGNNLPVAIEA